jgi:hypothetical protein
MDEIAQALCVSAEAWRDARAGAEDGTAAVPGYPQDDHRFHP